MRLKGVAVNDVVESVQKPDGTARINNEANSNNVPNSEDNGTSDNRQEWYAEDNITHEVNPNNNIAVDKENIGSNRQVLSCASPVLSREDDSYADSEGQSSSSLDASPQGDEYHCFSQEEVTDSDFSDDGNQYANVERGIVNPNYIGFQNFGKELGDPWKDESGTNINNNNNDNIEISDSVNHLDSVENFQKAFYNKPKFDIVNCGESDAKQDNSEAGKVENGAVSSALSQPSPKELADSGLGSGFNTDNEFDSAENGNNWFVQEDIVTTAIYPVSGIYETAILTDEESESSPVAEEPRDMASVTLKGNHFERVISPEEVKKNLGDLIRNTNKLGEERKNKVVKETENEKKMEEKIKKEEKTQMNVSTKKHSKAEGYVTYRSAKDKPRPNIGNRQSHPLTKDKGSNLDLGFFDVYNIETAMPKIDIDAIESHLRAAKEEERRANTNNGFVSLKTKFKESLNRAETNVEHNPIPQSPETPMNIVPGSDMKWFESGPKEMDWVPQVPKEENEDIVERFTNISDSMNSYKRTDREEIRRRLAMGSENDDYYGGERTTRKPNLQTRLQSGMNLQICFMNETMSDNESPSSDSELGQTASYSGKVEEEKTNSKRPDAAPVSKPTTSSIPPHYVRPPTSVLTLPLKKEDEAKSTALAATDFFSCQAQLQAEARIALSQAKEMARMQMEMERQALKISPITEMVRNTLQKVGVPFPQDRRRLSRQLLTSMNIAQLQVIVNDLHTQIEKLNDSLVKFLIGRDDLHMEQDSMLVDIEDLTRYLGAKENPQDVTNVGLIQKNNNTVRTQSPKAADGKPKD